MLRSLEGACHHAEAPSSLDRAAPTHVNRVDLEEAQRHFDLPVEDQLTSAAALRRKHSETRDSLLSLFAVGDAIPVRRGIEVEPGWLGYVLWNCSTPSEIDCPSHQRLSPIQGGADQGA